MFAARSIANSYPDRQIGDRFAETGMAEARADVQKMIEEAGLSDKLVALIVPNELHPNARKELNAQGVQLITIWGRTPEQDLQTVSQLIGAAKERHGNNFLASCGGRVGSDIIACPYLMDTQASVPPRTWR